MCSQYASVRLDNRDLPLKFIPIFDRPGTFISSYGTARAHAAECARRLTLGIQVTGSRFLDDRVERVGAAWPLTIPSDTISGVCLAGILPNVFVCHLVFVRADDRGFGRRERGDRLCCETERCGPSAPAPQRSRLRARFALCIERPSLARAKFPTTPTHSPADLDAKRRANGQMRAICAPRRGAFRPISTNIVAWTAEQAHGGTTLADRFEACSEAPNPTQIRLRWTFCCFPGEILPDDARSGATRPRWRSYGCGPRIVCGGIQRTLGTRIVCLGALKAILEHAAAWNTRYSTICTRGGSTNVGQCALDRELRGESLTSIMSLTYCTCMSRAAWDDQNTGDGLRPIGWVCS